MLCCCVRGRSSAGRSITSKNRLKDVAVITTCCLSFVAAFAVAMTTIAHGGAKNLAASVSILGSIILVPPVLVSLCVSRLTAAQRNQDQLGDEEAAAAHEFLELEQLTWTQFQEFSAGEFVLSHQDVEETGKLSFEGYLLRIGSGMQEVLIRKLELNPDQLPNLDVGELKQEIVKLGSIRRCNVLPMLGFTLDQSQLLLFMPKLRNLTDVLRSGLSWRCRCRVAALTARGLCRLHHSRATNTAAEECVSIVHGNIRLENIHLLEDGGEDSTSVCTPYIVDTGLLKLNSMPIFRATDTNAQTKSGYAAPEYSTGSGTLTPKADVYSFGIVLYVLLSGQTEVTELTPAKVLKSKLKRLMDPKLEKLYNPSQAKLIQQTALRCTQADPLQRPDMLCVEVMLRPLLLPT